MGCSLSKDSESPPNRSEKAWDAVLSKGLAVQTTKGFKSKDADYVEAILSANYGNLKKNAGTGKAMETHNLFLGNNSSGNQCQHDVTIKAGGDLMDNGLTSSGNTAVQELETFRKSLPNLRASHPKFTCESKALGICGSTEDTRTLGKPEIINTWQLMQGLEDDDESPSLASHSACRAFHSAACEVTSAALFSVKPQDVPSMEVPGKSIEVSPPVPSVPPCRSSLDEGASGGARSESFPSIRSAEEVDAAAISVCRNSKTPPMWDTTSSTMLEIGQNGNDTVFASGSAALDKISSDNSVPDSQKEAMARYSECSALSPDISHRILPIKTIFESFSGQHDRSLFASQPSDSTIDSSNDAVTFTTRSTDADCSSSPSSPEFSAAASLKDWLPNSGPLKQSVDDSQQPSVLRSNIGAFQDSEASSLFELHRQQSLAAATDLYNQIKRVRPTAFNKIESGVDPLFAKGLKSNLSCHETPKSVRKADKCTTPVFDPELLESLEKAVEQLSEDEWNALRKLEDKPESLASTDFLHLVNSMRRKGSYSVNAVRTTGNGNSNSDAAPVTGNKVVEKRPQVAVHSRSLDGNRNKQLSKERKVASRHHNSKGFQEGAEEDDERPLVFYSTSFLGNAKIYEDCNSVRKILRSLGTSFDERNIYLHPEYDQELRNLLQMPAVVPSLLVKGRPLWGFDSILHLHKKGGLNSLSRQDVQGRSKTACLCRGGKFLICHLCKGRGNLIRFGEGVSSCRHCSGTGLIKCPNCLLS